MAGLLLLMLRLAAASAEPADDPTWAPIPSPPPTAWALAGARSWRLCDEAGRQALAVRTGKAPPGTITEDAELWSKRARQCPHTPEVLVMAAERELMAAARIEWNTDDDAAALDAAVKEHDARIRQAVRWLDAALDEADRRGIDDPFEARYLRAYALVALGHPAEARPDIRAAALEGDVQSWRTDRMLALVELMTGHLEPALQLAHAAVVDADPEYREVSRYIWALVLDRAGAPDAARAELQALRADSGHTTARDLLQTLLPIHERLYLRALDHQANREELTARKLWAAYLARPEPEEPERELARRHEAEAAPLPAPVGGPRGGPPPPR